MIEIRKAELNDIQAIADLAEVIWTEHFKPIIGSEQVAYMLNKFQSYDAITHAVIDDGYIYYMAYCDDVMCAYCGIRPDADEIFLSKLYVHKDYRGRKLSRMFLKRVTADNSDCSRIRLTVNIYNENTIAAYKKMGFYIAEEKKADIGNGYYMDDYIMIKELK